MRASPLGLARSQIRSAAVCPCVPRLLCRCTWYTFLASLCPDGQRRRLPPSSRRASWRACTGPCSCCMRSGLWPGEPLTPTPRSENRGRRRGGGVLLVLFKTAAAAGVGVGPQAQALGQMQGSVLLRRCPFYCPSFRPHAPLWQNQERSSHPPPWNTKQLPCGPPRPPSTSSCSNYPEASQSAQRSWTFSPVLHTRPWVPFRG